MDRWCMDGWDRQTVSQSDKQTERGTDRQTDRQANRQTHKGWVQCIHSSYPPYRQDFWHYLPSSVSPGVSPHQLLRRYFVAIHNFWSIIHDNVRVVYLIVLLTIKSNFPKTLKDANWISHHPTTTTGPVLHIAAAAVKYSQPDRLKEPVYIHKSAFYNAKGEGKKTFIRNQSVDK